MRTVIKPLLLSISLCLLPVPVRASVSLDQQRKVFRLDGKSVTYALGVNERGELQPIYWGARLGDSDPLGPAHSLRDFNGTEPSTSISPQEFAGWGQGIDAETALKVRFPDGNRDLVLHFQAARADKDGLLVTLKDIERDLYVELLYSIDENTGILARSANILNRTRMRVVVDEAAAATWFVPRSRQYKLYHLAGRWGAEFQLQHQELGLDKIVLENRRGSTGHQNSPWFALQSDGDEESGNVWFGTLAWSGSWRITVERDVLGTVRVTGGFNPFDFAYGLAPGESLQTPVFYGGYSASGMGGASRALHRFELRHVVPGAPQPPLQKVLYNAWEATGFGQNAENQMKLADTAASLGVERFAIDDGWFGARNTDRAGLGDWQVNQQKFPGGLKALIDHVKALGMDFGFWIEPEMVNADSDLYRAHPDWVLHFNGRPRTEGRHQLVLNLARNDVRDFVFHTVDDLLANNDIRYVKWDYNRSFAEPGWPETGNAGERGEQEKLYVLFTQNLYSVLHELRERHPQVIFESCASGGGRADLGILRYTDEVWASDNTDPFDRLRIQDGLSYWLSPGLALAWATQSPNRDTHRVTSLRYRFLSAMQVGLGIGDDLRKWTPAEIDEAKTLVATYKNIRLTIQRGDLYRLVSPQDNGPESVTEYVGEDGKEAVLFAFLHSQRMGYPFSVVRLRGLDPDARYQFVPIAGAAAGPVPNIATGAYWMQMGFQPDLRGDFSAAAFKLTKLP